jgi:hypothetical protein
VAGAPERGVNARFGAPAERTPFLDLSQGQPFARCAVCKADSHASALTCCRCDARLDTPEQRAFNAAFWARRREEDDQLRAEVDRLRAARAEGEREAAQARRSLEWMDEQIARLRAGRRPARPDAFVITFAPDVRPLGLAIGRFLRRVVKAARAVVLRDPER